jgi:2-polyprenyl-3-methyl-5-hydroxy-6-metoxy-1,4-benzoquinol methylase
MSNAAVEERISNAHYGKSTEHDRSSKIFMRAMVSAQRKLRILDVGCGTGLNASLLSEQGHQVSGVDVSSVAIEKFQARGFQGLVGNIENGLPELPEASFDMVFTSEVIEHCPDTASFLSSIYALLKPGGSLLLSTPNSAFWASRIMALLGYTAVDYEHPGHVRFFSKRNLVAAITKAGFEVTTVAARHMYFIIGPRWGDPISPLLQKIGFEKEAHFAAHSHFWQLSRFARRADGFWADTLIVRAEKR